MLFIHGVRSTESGAARTGKYRLDAGSAPWAACTSSATHCLNQAVRARLEDTATECRHTREMLEAARSSGVAAEERAVEYRKEAETAKVRGRSGRGDSFQGGIGREASAFIAGKTRGNWQPRHTLDV